MLGYSINLNNFNCNPVVMKIFAKTSKNCHFWAQLVQKMGQYEPHPKQTKFLFAEMTKADHKLFKTFYFIICLD